MTFNHNRWLTSSLILGLFAIIALAAGTQATSSSSNVLVTNASAQPVPVKLIASTTAPINVNLSTHGKDGLMLHQTGQIPYQSANGYIIFSAIPGERFVITNISVIMSTGNNDFLSQVKLATSDQHGHTLSFAGFTPVTSNYSSENTSTVSAQTLIYLDPGQQMTFNLFRTSGEAESCDVTISGFRIAYP